MLNKVILMGRITQELELKQTTNGTAVLSFNVAVDRSYTKQGEEKQTDFITCVAWRKTAEFINNYFGKGRMIALEGQLRSRTYDDKNGTKHYVTEVYVDNVSFTGEPKQGENSSAPSQSVPKQNTPSQNASPQPAPSQNNSPATQSLGIDGFEEIFNGDDVPF